MAGAEKKGLSYKARRRLSLLILIVGIPLYIVVAVTVMTLLFPDPTNRPPILLELGIYVGLGLLWAFPLKAVFKGIGQADPDADPDA
jgi:hypothetical protein